MLKINTKLYKPIEFEIDGKIQKTKKIVNRIVMEGLRINEKMQAEGVTQLQQYEYLLDLIVLYTELDRDWIADNLDPTEMQGIISIVSEAITGSSEGVAAEPPLAGGATGDESPK